MAVVMGGKWSAGDTGGCDGQQGSAHVVIVAHLL